jgi:hypothetical protein
MNNNFRAKQNISAFLCFTLLTSCTSSIIDIGNGPIVNQDTNPLPANNINEPPDRAQTVGSISGNINTQTLVDLSEQMPEKIQVFLHGKSTTVPIKSFSLPSSHVNHAGIATVQLNNGTVLMDLYTGSPKDSIDLSISSTAVSSIMLLPEFITTQADLITKYRQWIESTPEFTSLVSALTEYLKYPQNTGLESRFLGLRDKVAKSVLLKLATPANEFKTQNSRFLPFPDLVQEEFNNSSPVFMSLPGDPLFGNFIKDTYQAQFVVKENQSTQLNVGFTNYTGVGHVGRMSILKSGQADNPSSWNLVPIEHLSDGVPAWNDSKGKKLFANTSPYFLIFPSKIKISPADLLWGLIKRPLGETVDENFGHIKSYSSFDLDANQNLESVLTNSLVTTENFFLTKDLSILNTQRQNTQDYHVSFLKANTRYTMETRSGQNAMKNLGNLLSSTDPYVQMEAYAVCFNIILYTQDLLSLFLGETDEDIDDLSDIIFDKDVLLTTFNLIFKEYPKFFEILTTQSPDALINFISDPDLRNANKQMFDAVGDAIFEKLSDKLKNFSKDQFKKLFLKRFFNSSSFSNALLDYLSGIIKAGKAVSKGLFGSISYLGNLYQDSQAKGNPYRVFNVNRYYPLPSIYDFQLAEDHKSVRFKVLYYNFVGEQAGEHASQIYLNGHEVDLQKAPALYSTLTNTSLIKNLPIPLGKTQTGYGFIDVQLNLTYYDNLLSQDNKIEVRNGSHHSNENKVDFVLPEKALDSSSAISDSSSITSSNIDNNSINTQQPNLRWKYFVNSGLPANITYSPPIDSNGNVYVSHNSALSSIKPDGTLSWTFKPDNGVLDESTEAVLDSENNIYIRGRQNTKKNTLFSIKPNGQLNWTISDVISSPTFTNNTIYCLRQKDSYYNDFFITAVSSEGNILLDSEHFDSVKYLGGFIANPSLMLGTDKTIYLQAPQSGPIAFDLDGKIKWRENYSTVKNYSFKNKTSLKSNNYLILPGNESGISIKNAKGEEIGYYPTHKFPEEYTFTQYPPGGYHSDALVAQPLENPDGNIVLITASGKVHIVAPDGKQIKMFSLFEQNPAGNSYSQGSKTPVIDSEGNIYIPYAKKIYSFTKEGSKNWEYSLPQDSNTYITSSLTIDENGNLYFYASDNCLYSITGAKKPNEKIWYKFNKNKSNSSSF